MLRVVTTAFLVILAGSPVAVAQGNEQYDVASFTLPAGWTREETPSAVRLTRILAAERAYCQVNIYKSAPGSGDAATDFDADWRELVAGPFELNAPTKLSRPGLAGWTHRAGQGSTNQATGTVSVTLTTYVAATSKVSVLTLANHRKCTPLLAAFAKGLSLTAPGTTTTGTTPPPTTTPTSTGSGVTGFQFTTSNFDDGWVATIEPEWVRVEKDGVRVYLYYVVPYDSRNFDGTGVMDRDYYWGQVVSRQFELQSTQYRDDGEAIGSLKPKYVEGWGVDRATRERRFVAMTLGVGPNAALLTVASAPDEQALRRAFPKANDRWASDLSAMSRFNKFAIGPRDLAGMWQSGGTQMTQWYDARTGAYAGATVAATSATFVFAANGTYRSVHNGATGAVGSMKTFQQEYKGSYKVTSWSLTATHRYEGKPQTFAAHLQAVRGGRLLFLDDGRGSSYLLVRTAK